MSTLSTAQSPSAASPAMGWAEQGLVPDPVIRAGIRRLTKQRLSEIQSSDIESVTEARDLFVQHMCHSVIAPLPELANEQHYEVPAGFFDLVLGRHRKYSACFWDESTESLDAAEKGALELTCQRAGIENGMDVLDLGCGWGSLSLWIAEHYPACSVTAVSNSSAQKQAIEAIASSRNLANVEVVTCDMNDFFAPAKYDRIVSVEMFEHMRNYEVLFERISQWLRKDGQFFMHIFCHRNAPYAFEDNGPGDWMSRHFFSGGIMPSADLPARFQRHLQLQRQWAWDGRHYEKTANAWLANLDRNVNQVRPLFAKVYGKDHADQWIQRWRIFFMACAELFGYRQGQEWFVSHYRFGRHSVGEA